jgi:hypothetical protein
MITDLRGCGPDLIAVGEIEKASRSIAILFDRVTVHQDSFHQQRIHRETNRGHHLALVGSVTVAKDDNVRELVSRLFELALIGFALLRKGLKS